MCLFNTYVTILQIKNWLPSERSNIYTKNKILYLNNLLLFINNFHIFEPTKKPITMRKLNILKTLIDLAFFLSIIGLFGAVIFATMFAFDSEGGIPIKLQGQELTSDIPEAKIVIGFAAISYLLFVYALFLLRKVIGFFKKRDLFNVQNIRYFNTIGVCLILSTLLAEVPFFIFNMIQRNHLGLQMEDGGFDTPLLSIALGLFFMVLSEAFKIAKGFKEENELTV